MIYRVFCEAVDGFFTKQNKPYFLFSLIIKNSVLFIQGTVQEYGAVLFSSYPDYKASVLNS
jgi:hypothetical protein